MFIALITQDREGCDYTIACGKNWIELEANNKDDAIEELKKCVIGILDDNLYYGCDGGFWGEKKLSEVILLEVSNKTSIPIANWYAQAQFDNMARAGLMATFGETPETVDAVAEEIRNTLKKAEEYKNRFPSFLIDKLPQEVYERWLRRKAQAPIKRDRQRGNKTANGKAYRAAIHSAVLESGGRDFYTGEELDWSLISKYDNDKSKENGRNYKHSFAMLPTIDHVGDGMGSANFKICSWRTNDAKNDLELPVFLTLCQTMLEYQGYAVAKPKRG
jgi:hypothetical protein